ncbi:MAG: di-heme oxidoredictase family protein [Arcobacteraceae bacterium]
MNILKAMTAVVISTTIVLANIHTTKPSQKGFSTLLDNLNDEEIDQAILGKSFFRIPWVEAPSATTARDGLGPLFNANTCTSCHPNNAYTNVFTQDGQVNRSMVVRLSIPSNHSKEHQAFLETQGFVPDPMYGAQLSLNGTTDVPFEGKLKIAYTPKEVVYADGSKIELRVPVYSLTDLNYGNLHKDIRISVRKAPALVGLGLIEQISDEQILANTDPEDKNNDGIRGVPNYVYSIKDKKMVLGKLTYKGSAPTLKQQIASAFHNDMSLTTTYFPHDNCTNQQKECLNAKKARDAIDVPDDRVEAIDFYLKNLKLPVVENKNQEGKALFSQIGCASCHTPSFSLPNNQKAEVYSDFLLHDMGDELSDGRSEFNASKNQWRTTPLWGINSYKYTVGAQVEYLHDGRARSLEEAIVWHGGEALKAKESFLNLSQQQRDALIEFLGEL